MSKGFYSSKAFKSSQDETWKTPKCLWEQLNNEFSFGMDACALKSSTLVSNNWFGPDHDEPTRRDCLVADWSKASNGMPVFMNPPYGRTIKLFMEKASSCSDLVVVCLVPARTDTAWFHNYVFNKDAHVRFLRGRLKFNDAMGVAPFPSAIVVYQS